MNNNFLAKCEKAKKELTTLPFGELIDETSSLDELEYIKDSIVDCFSNSNLPWVKSVAQYSLDYCNTKMEELEAGYDK